MEQVLTLVSAKRFGDEDLSPWLRRIDLSAAIRLGPNAVDIITEDTGDGPKELAENARTAGFDVALQPREGRQKRVLLCDMDSTIIQQECIDEIGKATGCGDAIAEVTERAMRGEIDFESALQERVSQLKGVSRDTLKTILSDAITLSPGAETLIATMKAQGAFTALVSGGFTFFTEAIAQRLGFDAHRGNQLAFDDQDTLTGAVTPPVLGPRAKVEALAAFCDQQGTPVSAAMAIGDGANDAEMINAVDLGIAYRAKPMLRTIAAATIDHTDLTTALYFQGIPQDAFAR